MSSNMDSSVTTKAGVANRAGEGNPTTVVFDVGGVLIDWDPRHVYREIFDGDKGAMEHFLTHICSHTWNLMQDAGRSFAEGVALLTKRYPEYGDQIAAYDERWEEMVSGAIDDSVAVLHALKDRGTPLYSITNFSREKFALTRERFDFFEHFIDIVVSAEVHLIKPDPAIFLHLCDDNSLDAADCVFIDDAPINVAGAERVGMHAILFESPAQLRRDLAALGLL